MADISIDEAYEEYAKECSEPGCICNENRELYGHPDFYRMLDAIRELHSAKNHDYACGGDPLGNFKRVASILGQYPGLDLSKGSTVAVVYMLKQLDAVLWMESNGHEAIVEGAEERWKDIAVYAIIASILQQQEADGKLR